MTLFRLSKLLAFAVLLWPLTGCVHYQDRLAAALDPWVSQHPDRLVEKWGAPDSTYAMSSGVKVLTYTSDRTVSRYSGLGYTSWRFGNYTYTDSCKISFFSDPGQKQIDRYTTSGEASACVEIIRDYPAAK